MSDDDTKKRRELSEAVEAQRKWTEEQRIKGVLPPIPNEVGNYQFRNVINSPGQAGGGVSYD